jgi:hypothetical protein
MMDRGLALSMLFASHGGITSFRTEPARDADGNEGFINVYVCADGWERATDADEERDLAAHRRAQERRKPD